MRQPYWDKYEIALLIEAYWRVKADNSRRGVVVAELSSSLRKRVSYDIDDTFRNENGISMRLRELDYLFSEGTVGLKNTSKLFCEMVELYQNNLPEYESILLEAKEITASLESPLISDDTSADRQMSELTETVSTLVRDFSGSITKDVVCERCQNYNKHQIDLALAACHAVNVLGKYYHQDNISDYQEMADTLLEVMMRLFAQNGNYISAQQLYNEVRPRLDDFFFYNNAFDSRQEVYDLAVHLFKQEKYKGHAFIFVKNTHIWKEEPDYPKDYHGLLIKYAREHGNVFTREAAVSYLEQIGSATPAATFSSVIYKTGSETFLQFMENQFVLTEVLQINDYFISLLTAQIKNLLEEEDYIAIGEIDDYFYSTLPKLPSGICWSALLLEDVLRICETGFMTIEAGKDNDKKTIPAAIVRKGSHYQCFSDVVWNEVSKSFSLPKEFTATEFRTFLLNRGFIRGSEKKWTVHKTVAGDIRFYWTDNNGMVTIN